MMNGGYYERRETITADPQAPIIQLNQLSHKLNCDCTDDCDKLSRVFDTPTT